MNCPKSKLGKVGLGSNTAQNHSSSLYEVISCHYLLQGICQVDQKWNQVKWESVRTFLKITLQGSWKLWKCSHLMLPQRHTRNIATMLRESCENVGTWSCCNIFQERFKSVATTLPQNVVRKHLHNSMATFIDNVEVLWYSQCCGNLSAIWENPRRKYQDKL